MHKVTLLSILMPMLIMASDQPITEEAVVLRGYAVLSLHRPQRAKDILAHYQAKDAKWLSIALGAEIDPEMPLLRVLIDLRDGELPKYLSDRIRFKHRTTGELIGFPGWLPLTWFKDAKDGDVVNAKLCGKAVEIVCEKQAGGKSFNEALAGLMEPRQLVECELHEMDGAMASCSQDELVNVNE